MVCNSTQRGFTLIEIVLVLVLIGILTAIAIPKYIDITDKAEEAAAVALANQFAADVNNELANRMLKGENCSSVRASLVRGGGSIGEKYQSQSNNGMNIFVDSMATDSSPIPVVFTNKKGESYRVVVVPSRIATCDK